MLMRMMVVAVVVVVVVVAAAVVVVAVVVHVHVSSAILPLDVASTGLLPLCAGGVVRRPGAATAPPRRDDAVLRAAIVAPVRLPPLVLVSAPRVVRASLVLVVVSSVKNKNFRSQFLIKSLYQCIS